MTRSRRLTFLTALLAASLSLAILVPTASAAKSGATIAISDPTPSAGDTITVTVSDVVTKQPYVLVYVRCETDGALIYVSGGIANRLETTHTLMSLSWLSGAASCEVLVVETYDGMRHTKVIAELAFEVSA